MAVLCLVSAKPAVPADDSISVCDRQGHQLSSATEAAPTTASQNSISESEVCWFGRVVTALGFYSQPGVHYVHLPIGDEQESALPGDTRPGRPPRAAQNLR